jgi:hypothetical protein
VIGRQEGPKTFENDTFLNFNYSGQLEDENPIQSLHTPSFQGDEFIEQNISDELLIFTCPFIGCLCFVQTFSMAEFNIHSQEHAIH